MSNRSALSEDAHFEKLFNAVNSQDAVQIEELLNNYPEPDDTPDPVDVPGPVTPEPTETQPAATDENTPAPDAPADWRDRLPEEIRDQVLSEFNALSQQYRYLQDYRSSNEGRVSGLQKKINALEAQLNAVKTAAPSPSPAPTSQDETDPLMKEIKESDPALYEVLKKREEALLRSSESVVERRIKEVDQRFAEAITPLQQKALEDHARQEAQRVLERVPNVEAIVRSKEWNDYLELAPPRIVEMAQSNNADEFVAAIDAFSVWAFRTFGPVTQPEPQRQPAAPAPSSRADAIADARSRRINAAPPASRNVPAARPEDIDEEKLLESMFLEIMAKNTPRK